MGIQYLYDDGYPPGKKRPFPEDGIIYMPTATYGVVDGVSFYSPRSGPPLFDGLTQGMLATRVVIATFLHAQPYDSLREILREANHNVRRQALRYGLSLKEPEHLPGADIAVVRINDEEVIAINTSDCGVMLVMRNGSVWISPNQSLVYEQEVERIFALIKRKHEDDPNQLDKAWDEWLPIRTQMVREYGNKKVPNGWAMIDGQYGFDGLWQESRFPRKDVALAICYTDGFTTVEETANSITMGRWWAELYASGGLLAILNEMRREQRAKLSQSHEANLPEATAIAIPIAP